MMTKINTLTPFFQVILVFSCSLFLLLSCENNNRQDSETISKEVLQKAVSIKTGSGLDYFKSQPNHELMHINGQTLNVLVSGDEISVLMRM